jgi:2-haloacid dehalogenase
MTGLVVLDVNETLSDVSALRPVFAGIGLPEAAVATWFAAVLRDGFALTAVGAPATFAELGRSGLRTLLADRPAEADDAAEAVLQAFRELPLHADVAPGLAALREAGLRVVTLSNGSAAVAESLLGRAGVADLVEAFLTVEDVGPWKPAGSAYRHALTATGVAAGEALMAAAHPWDVDGAHRAGLRTAYVDRTGAPYPAPFAEPDLTVTGLDRLADRLTS